jgi:hypothetical protein
MTAKANPNWLLNALIASLAWCAQACSASVFAKAGSSPTSASAETAPASGTTAPSVDMANAAENEAGPVALAETTTMASVQAGGPAQPTAAPAAAPAIALQAPAVPQPAPAPGAARPQDADQALLAEAHKMVDIEARLTVEVDDVARATAQARELVNKSGGQIVEENVSQQAGVSRAELTLRVPASAAGDFLGALAGLGAVRVRQVIAKDIGKEFYDANLRLANLEVARKRYEEILLQARAIDEILRLEAELTRLRNEIEALKGQVRWLRDRSARATVHLSLYTPGAAPPIAIVKPKAKLHPGLRLSYLNDLRGDDGHQGYFGAGLSLGAFPSATLELQGFREVGSDSAGLDGLFVTLNGRFYSEYLGNGDREFLNPYLGLRVGYARFLGKNEIIAGGAVGVELFKRDWFLLELDLRSYALFASSAGGHLGIEPSLGVSVAF